MIRTDRVILGITIIRHAQQLTEMNGEGLRHLEECVLNHKMTFEGDQEDKGWHRKELWKSFFFLARAEQQVLNGEQGLKISSSCHIEVF
jgi:hypothetical protein